jgi:hypothetical protein
MSYENMTDGDIRSRIDTLKYERAHLKQENSGQASNYYAPAIFYLEEELKKRDGS